MVSAAQVLKVARKLCCKADSNVLLPTLIPVEMKKVAQGKATPRSLSAMRAHPGRFHLLHKILVAKRGRKVQMTRGMTKT